MLSALVRVIISLDRDSLGIFSSFRDAMKNTTDSTSAGGSWIRDPQAQSFLLDLLRRTEAENGWPWTFVMQKLSQDWRLTVR